MIGSSAPLPDIPAATLKGLKMEANHVPRRIWYLLLATFLAPLAAIRAELPTDCHSDLGADWGMEESCDCGCDSRFRLAEFTIYPTFSFQGEKSATYTEFEFASYTDLGCWEMENRTVLNVADLPSTIRLGPTNPGGLPSLRDVRASGFGDVLSGFFFGRKGDHEDTHFRVGPVWTFPSATDDILGSGQWTVGPGVHYSTEIDRLTAGFFLWQSWGFAVDDSHKRINQLFGKPFVIYEMTEKWHLVYIPLGMSHSWEKPNKYAWTVPLGGGVRRLFKVGCQEMGLQAQFFDYVARKEFDPEWEFRMTIEFLFD